MELTQIWVSASLSRALGEQHLHLVYRRNPGRVNVIDAGADLLVIAVASEHAQQLVIGAGFSIEITSASSAEIASIMSPKSL